MNNEGKKGINQNTECSDEKTKKLYDIMEIPLYSINPSQTHISTTTMDPKGNTVPLSSMMKFYAEGGEYNKLFNVVKYNKRKINKDFVFDGKKDIYDEDSNEFLYITTDLIGT